MKRVENNEKWSLMNPEESPGLSEVYGDDFDKLYTKYESEGKFVKQIDANELWERVLDSEIETGMPFLLFNDSCNKHSNQKNLGVIEGSNLCTEIIEYSSREEPAVCVVASISLKKFVEKDNSFNFKHLGEITRLLTRNLNKIIDINSYPLKGAEISRKKSRPIGIGAQGFFDALAMLRYPFDSSEAAELNKKISETMYYHALLESSSLAEKYGPYETYEGSPISKGILHHDSFGAQTTMDWDWNNLREKIKTYGVRNSLLIAHMPTVSTSQILGNFPSMELPYSNFYLSASLCGDYQIVNKYLLKDLEDLGLWNEEMRNKTLLQRGSIQKIDEIPKELKKIYKTVWEVPQGDSN